MATLLSQAGVYKDGVLVGIDTSKLATPQAGYNPDTGAGPISASRMFGGYQLSNSGIDQLVNEIKQSGINIPDQYARNFVVALAGQSNEAQLRELGSDFQKYLPVGGSYGQAVSPIGGTGGPTTESGTASGGISVTSQTVPTQPTQNVLANIQPTNQQTQPTEYLRQKGTNEVFAISNGGAYYVPYDYAMANNVFSQVQDVDYRIDQKYPISGNVSQISTSGGNTQPGADLGQPGVSGGQTGVVDFTNPPPGSTIPAETWNQLSETDKAFMTSLYDMTKSQYDAGQANVSINQDLLNKALARATTEMTARYGETASMATASLVNNLGLINAEFGQNYSSTLQQQQVAQKDLSEQFANVGQAISGFRQKAQSQLQTQQTGVIESSKRQLQQQLNQLGSQYESQYGTSALPNIMNQTAGLAYNPVGGITGSQEYAKQADIQGRQQQIYNLEQSPLS